MIKRAYGFTLAEVLITLGIIGILAALTMPTILQKYRTHVTETRLKGFYSNINQAIRLSEGKHGDKKEWSYTYGAYGSNAYSEEVLKAFFW